MSDVSAPRTTPNPFPANWAARLSLLALVLYVVYACSTLDITWTRFEIGRAHV